MDTIKLPNKAIYDKEDFTEELNSILKQYFIRDLTNPESVRGETTILIDGSNCTPKDYTSFWYLWRTRDPIMLEKFPHSERIKYMQDKLASDQVFNNEFSEVLETLNTKIFIKVVRSRAKYSCIRINHAREYAVCIFKIHTDFVLCTFRFDDLNPCDDPVKNVFVTYFESDD